MAVRVLSLGRAVPLMRISQDDALAVFGYTSPKAKRIFRESAVITRHHWVPADKLTHLSWQEQTEQYHAGAVALSVQAVDKALCGYRLADVRSLTFCSVTGYTCPSLSYEIAGKLGLPEDIVHGDLIGMGCQGGLPGLERAYDSVRGRSGLAVMVATEICSATYFPAPEDDWENLVANAIFADGSAAAVVGESDDLRYPEVIGFGNCFKAEYLDLLGYKWQDGRLKVVLSPDVPRVVPGLMKQTIERLLERHGVGIEEVGTWVIHPGGKQVLMEIERTMGLSRHHTRHSWDILRDYGNCSSATIGMIAQRAHREATPGYGVVCTMGAGTAVAAALLKWGA